MHCIDATRVKNFTISNQKNTNKRLQIMLKYETPILDSEVIIPDDIITVSNGEGPITDVE